MVNVMAQITLKKLPDEVYRELQRRAKRYKRSLNSEIIHTLEKSTMSTELDPDEVIEKAKKLHSKLNIRVTQKEIKEAKNYGRYT